MTKLNYDDTANAPLIVVLRHLLPVVSGEAPVLAGGAESIWGGACTNKHNHVHT